MKTRTLKLKEQELNICRKKTLRQVAEIQERKLHIERQMKRSEANKSAMQQIAAGSKFGNAQKGNPLRNILRAFEHRVWCNELVEHLERHCEALRSGVAQEQNRLNQSIGALKQIQKKEDLVSAYIRDSHRREFAGSQAKEEGDLEELAGIVLIRAGLAGGRA